MLLTESEQIRLLKARVDQLELQLSHTGEAVHGQHLMTLDAEEERSAARGALEQIAALPDSATISEARVIAARGMKESNLGEGFKRRMEKR